MVLTKSACPLSSQHCQVLNQVLSECSQTAELLAAMARAGVPMEEYETHNKLTAQTAAALRKEFFPDMQ